MTLRKSHRRITASAMAGFSPSTGARLEKDPRLPSQKKAERRHGGGKPDPLDGIWDSDVVPMLEAAPALRPITILHELCRRYPDRNLMAARRTIERRVTHWKALHGPEREIIFRQEHPPGRQGMSDFFDAADLRITVARQPLAHRIFHFALVYSGWEHAELVLGGESFTALAVGLQNALWTIGGVPTEHRTDSLSAAFANLAADDREDIRTRYDELCGHYGMTPTRNNRGMAHENGAIESRHGHLKTRLDQALLLRGSRDFDSLDDYRRFLAETIGRHNALRRDAVVIEAPHLKPLPERRTTDYTEARVLVTRSGGFSFDKVFYTVPSRFIGHRLKLRVYDDRLECHLGTSHVLDLRRGRAPGNGRGKRGHVVSYHHVIAGLRRKPQALANLIYRDDLFPRRAYADTWDALTAVLDQRRACRVMVGLLWLAHARACEADLADILQEHLDAGRLPDLADLEKRFQPEDLELPPVTVTMPGSASYDVLLAG